MKNNFSLMAYIVSVFVLFYATFIFYPKWNNKGTEATISWDVSGYYMYLPAIFIYQDIKGCNFKDKILKEYGPTPDFQQAMKIDEGKYVMKYSIGQAFQFAPFFAIAHLWASNSDRYKADGFSFPYQFMITIESFLIALTGLWFLRLILLWFFKDIAVAITILATVLGSNYLDYSTMAGAMTHNNLFTIYAVLIYATYQFYKHPGYKYAVIIGLLVGLATLTRPTEMISMFIPLLWGVRWGKKYLKERLIFIKENTSYYISAMIAMILVGSIQLIYWKYATGHWIVYSYDDQGFSFLRPHFWAGIFSYRSGWLVYSPLMLFSLIGFYQLYKNHQKIFTGLFVFFIVFIYLTFAWNIWWYGGSLGIRAMVQSYPILAFPFAAFVEYTANSKYWKYAFAIIFIVFSYYNLWLTRQAHKGGMLHVGFMTKAYFWKILGRYHKNENDLKLLDTKECFEGYRKNVKVVYANNFEKDTMIADCGLKPIQGQKSLCMNKETQWKEIKNIKLSSDNGNWLRASADFLAPWKEWNVWKMMQFIIVFNDKSDHKIKERMIRVYRLLSDNKLKNLFLDSKIPPNTESVTIKFWNAQSDKKILIDNLKLETYEGEN